MRARAEPENVKGESFSRTAPHYGHKKEFERENLNFMVIKENLKKCLCMCVIRAYFVCQNF